MSTFDDLIAAADRRLERLPLQTMSVNAGGRAFEIAAVRDQDRLLAAAEDFAIFPFGVLLWESAPALGDVLGDMDTLRGKAVLELGAGSGLAGLVAAALGARVVQTDHSYEALALCRRNAAANGISGVTLQFADWTDWTDRIAFDLVIAADVLYEPNLYIDLLGVLTTAVRPGGTALITDPGRVHAGRFAGLLEEAGWTVRITRRVMRALPPCEPSATVSVDVIEARRAV